MLAWSGSALARLGATGSFVPSPRVGSMAPTPLLTLSLRKALGCYLLLAVPLVWLGIVTTDVFRMEGLIANGAASMQSWEDACVPKVYGEIYAYKPPLAYWLAKGSFAGFDSIDRIMCRHRAAPRRQALLIEHKSPISNDSNRSIDRLKLLFGQSLQIFRTHLANELFR